MDDQFASQDVNNQTKGQPQAFSGQPPQVITEPPKSFQVNATDPERPKTRLDKKSIAAIIGTLILVVGLVTGAILVQRRQEIRREAQVVDISCRVVRDNQPTLEIEITNNDTQPHAYQLNKCTCSDPGLPCNDCQFSLPSIGAGEVKTETHSIPGSCGAIQMDVNNVPGEGSFSCFAIYSTNQTCVTPTPTPTPAPTPTPSPPPAQIASCQGLTGTLPSASQVQVGDPLDFIMSATGDNLTQLEVCFHGNFEGPGWGSGWACLRDLTPSDGSYPSTNTGPLGSPPTGSDFGITSGSFTYTQVKNALVATGHNPDLIDFYGVVYGANVFQQQGICFSTGIYTGPGSSTCQVDPTCTGGFSLLSLSTPPPTPAGSAACNDVRAYRVTGDINDPDNWLRLSLSDLANLNSGDVVYFTVSGLATFGEFKKAQFTINGVARSEVTGQKPKDPIWKDLSVEFYDAYTVPDNQSNFSVQAKIFHTINGWL